MFTIKITLWDDERMVIRDEYSASTLYVPSGIDFFWSRDNSYVGEFNNLSIKGTEILVNYELCKDNDQIYNNHINMVFVNLTLVQSSVHAHSPGQ